MARKMARAMPTASFLPTIKCSNCAAEVELSSMGDHLCSTTPQADEVVQPVKDRRGTNGVSRMMSQKKRSFSRSGTALRVDSSVANRLYFPPNELTPASSGTMPSTGGPYGQISPSHTTQRNHIGRVAHAPPSPEYSNLDCAFPPFPIKTQRNLSSAQEPTGSSSHLGNDHRGEQAEFYGQSRPGSPYSAEEFRARSTRLSKRGDRSGIIGARPDMISRPSTANGARKPSLASIIAGPKPAGDERPPLPPSAITTAAALATPKLRRAGFVGLKPDSPQNSKSPRQIPQQSPLSPNRTQTHPLRNEDRLSGNGPNSFMARRSSQPLPMSTTPPAAQSTSLRSARDREPRFRANAPSNQNVSSRTQVDNYLPHATSRNGYRPAPGHPPVPDNDGGHMNFDDEFASSGHRHFPAQISPDNSDVLDRNHTRPETETSDATGASRAQIGTLRSSPPRAKQFLNNRNRTDNQAPYSPLPELSLPPKPSVSSTPPESPTDPLCYQGHLSPLPHAGMKSPFSIPSSSSGSSSVPSWNQSSQDLPDWQQNPGVNKGLCRGCSRYIMAGQKSISSKDGRLTGRYHKQCFACHTCQSPFETADFYVHDDRPFCAEHYHALNGSLCNGCGQGIEGQYLAASTSEEQGAEKFHPRCLTCSTCGVSLQDDYFEWNGKAYCERDAAQAADVPMRSPNDAFLSPRQSPSPGSDLPSRPSPLGRPGLPSGPRAGLRPPGPGQTFSSANGFLAPLSASGGPRAPPSGRRFPERRTTKLMMI